MIWDNYKAELRHDAASAKEASELAALARQISRLKVPPLSAEAKARVAHNIGFTPRRLIWPWMLGLGSMAAVALIAVVTMAQYAHPGSALYSIKHESDRLEQFIHSETSLPTVPSSDDKNSHDTVKPPQSGTDEHHSVTATPLSSTKRGDDNGSATPLPFTTTSGGSGSTSGDGGTSGGGGTGTSGGNGTTGGGTSGDHGGKTLDDSISGSGH